MNWLPKVPLGVCFLAYQDQCKLIIRYMPRMHEKYAPAGRDFVLEGVTANKILLYDP